MSTESSSPPRWKYHVFLSFRGEDTRKGFTDHLYTALDDKGITTFMDDPELQKGEAISPAPFAAIEDSGFALIVLSQNYASSTWCLNELVKILECMKSRGTVLPIFYDVDPSDVHKQTGRFKEAFIDHEERFKDDKEKVQRWRSALTEVATFSGWNSKEWYEAKLVRDIVEVIWKKLQPTSFSFAENLVGINSRLQPLNLLLGEGMDDVRFIGIWGMGGIGKTTMVRAVYERISHEFEFSFLLTDVRDFVERSGLLILQKQLLSAIWTKGADISDLYEGATRIRRLLGQKKVLLILDDVTHSSHLKYLAGNQDWFGSGSRVLITTRDEYLLIERGVERRLKVEEFNYEDSLQLFCWKAFKRGYPEEDFLDLSKSAINYAKGLPLALEVLGSLLHGRDLSVWNSALRKLGRVCNLEIFDILKTSYDSLDDEEKKIFLDISCFFCGEDKDRVEKVLISCNVSAIIGIKVLTARSLLTVSYGRLGMHDLLQEMGREIVRRESTKEPGRRSRLWLPEDIKHVLTKNTGTEAIEGIVLDSTELGVEVEVNAKSFLMMNRLRYLVIENGNLPNGLECLPDSLRILKWTGYPSKSLPLHFNPEELRELEMCHSCIEHLPLEIENLPCLTVINLSYSCKLKRTPDFTHAPGPERLILEGCTSLEDIHPSIAHLERLTCLNLKDCRSLKSLPSKLETRCLQILNLSGCSKVKKIPDFVGSMEGLLELHLDETAIEQIPVSVRLLTGLIFLNLRDCKNLKRLPRDIGNLQSLKRLNICGCSKLETLPDSLGKIDCLEELDAAGGSSISNIPSSISCLENLEVLSLCGCKGLSGNMTRYPFSFLLPISGLGGLHSLTVLNLSDCNLQEGSLPEDFGCLFPLVSLNLSKNNFYSLPKSIRQLSKLCNLNLESCKTLQKLPDLSSSLNFSFGADDGFSQERLSSFNLINCSKLVVNQRCNNIALKMLWRFLQCFPFAGNRFETIIPGSEISELFSDQSVGPVISMELPRQWYKNKWMGYAFCACFVIRRYLPVAANRLGKWKFGTHSTANGLRCEVKPENLGVAGWCPSFVCSQELGQIESEHLWLSFVSGNYFGTAWQETCHNIDFTFKPLGTGMGVKKCGVRLIYEQDLDLIGMKR